MPRKVSDATENYTRLLFFELADEPVEVIMNVDEAECEKLFALLSEEKLGIFYTKTAIEFGTI